MEKLNKNEIYELAHDLLNNPELGYKEFKTKEILIKFLKNKGFEINNECFETAFSVSIGKGHPHIGLIAELDAIPTLGHKYSSKVDNAAHSCGHFSQCVIMTNAISTLKNHKFNGKITLFFTPAEEFTDIKYRESLISKKKIKYIGGKINMINKGLFDDVDIMISCHAMANSKYKYSVGSNLAGFVYKKIIFKGKAAHGAVSPHLGVNALNAYALFNDALNMLRETFKEEDTIRIHGILSEGGQTVNSIPERVVYECYVRSCNNEALINTSNLVDNAAKSCTKAIGASAKVITSPGYLPLIQNKEINDVVYSHMLKIVNKDLIEVNNPSMAAGDIGDVSQFIPTIQFGYGGFDGVPHGKDFILKDEEFVYIDTSKLVSNFVLDLIKNPKLINSVKKNYKVKMSKNKYRDYINGK